MNILNSVDTAATINLITRNARGTTTTSDGATSAGLTAKENLSHLISGGFDMPHPTSIFEGVPPFSFISNGDPLVNWIIYGNTGGVGEKTDNLFDGIVESGYYNDSGVLTSDTATGHTINYIAVDTTTYTISGLWYNPGQMPAFAVYEWDENKEWLRRSNRQYPTETNTITFTIGADTKYITLQISVNHGNIMLNTGGTAKSYEPYGYKIPVICGGVTTNIYIDEPLTSGETISYNDTGVIIPTTMFLNTLSVGTTVQPEKVFIEYVK